MKKALIIVESPAKAKTLRKFLGNEFALESSVGHIRDLPARKFGIDVDHDFTPEYEVLEAKKEVVDRLKKAAASANIVYLASDPDREGEAIAWHIAAILPKNTKYERIAFNEFTKDAVNKALKNPRAIDEHLVNAQQARRLLDRMVGYKISPILHRKIQRGSRETSLSAGRVQSAALKLVIDREREIDAFLSIEYWNLGSLLQKQDGGKTIYTTLHSVDGKRVEKEAKENKECFIISNEKVAKEIEDKLKKATYKVSSIDRKEKKRNPVPPFITSTLQQEAARHYGFSATRTMAIAQGLYEGIEMGPLGTEGLITYMRTDSPHLSKDAQEAAIKYITNTYGKEYLPPTPPQYASKKHAQEAHEAIRPTNTANTPESVQRYLSTEQYKLYLLVWRRYLASQMKPAIYDTVTCDIETNQGLLLRTTGSVIKFPGFLIAYEEKEDHTEERADEKAGDKKEEPVLPDLREGETLKFLESFAKQAFTQPPPRFTEASLVKELEKSGIGRPSTYAATMQKILSRAYTEKERQTLKPTELGKIICQMLEDNFPKIINVKFTAEMEDSLDKIAETDVDWRQFLKTFWDDFYPTVEAAEKEAHVPKVLTDKLCPDCQHPLQKIWGKDRYFLGCSTYPECKYTAPLEEFVINKEEYKEDFDWDQHCPKCTLPMKARSSRFGVFLGCTGYPECKGIVNIPKKGEEILTNLPPCPAIGCTGQIGQRRSRFGKTFFSCSTYPDCDVIANSLEELSEKYQNHARTAYVSKRKGAKTKVAAKAKATTKAKSKTKATAKTKATTKAKTTKTKAPANLLKTSPILDAIIGMKEISRTEATKKLWDYIKAHDLQDPKNRRNIRPDAKLAALFDTKEPVDMMKLATHLSRHLIKS